MSNQLTPYDTGERLEPHPYVQRDPQLTGARSMDDYGKVDFDNEESCTVFKLHAERDGEGYTLKVQDLSYTPLTVEVDSELVAVTPTETLRAKVKEAIAELRTEIERESADVFWEWKTALILVPGERHVRKQQLIMVHDTELNPVSAKVGGWADGIRDTRID
jgi:hypothetical protein